MPPPVVALAVVVERIRLHCHHCHRLILLLILKISPPPLPAVASRSSSLACYQQSIRRCMRLATHSTTVEVSVYLCLGVYFVSPCVYIFVSKCLGMSVYTCTSANMIYNDCESVCLSLSLYLSVSACTRDLSITLPAF